jgi:hypothetical protein
VLDQVETLAKIVSFIALPFVVALGGWWVQRSLATQAVNKDYVALAVSLLDESREVPPEVRAWAVDMLNRNAPVALADSVSAKLKRGELSIPNTFDARQSVIRSSPTNLTRMIGDAMLRATPEAQLSIFNSGAVRLDAILPASTLSRATVVQMLPFGNDIEVVSMSGRLIENILQDNSRRVGTGNFMHIANVDMVDGWRIAGTPINPRQRYVVATIDFLVTSGAFASTPQDRSDIVVLRTGKSLMDAVLDDLLSRVAVRP